MSEQKTEKLRILVADDDLSIRQLLCTIIRRERIEADCASDGAEAIEKIAQTEYAVILLDLMMPRIDGFGVIEYLRNHPQPNKPVVLVISAYADQKFREVDPNVVAGVLRKPFEIADIGSLVRHCVSGIENSTREMQSGENGIPDGGYLRFNRDPDSKHGGWTN